MGHFAQTHSLTLVGNQQSQLRLILIANKPRRGVLPCYWLRFRDMDVEEAISAAGALLPESFNVAVAIARPDISDGAIAAAVAQALSLAGLPTVELQKFSGASRLQGVA